VRARARVRLDLSSPTRGRLRASPAGCHRSESRGFSFLKTGAFRPVTREELKSEDVL